MFIELSDIKKQFEEEYICSLQNTQEKKYCLSGFCVLTAGYIPSVFSLHTVYVIKDHALASQITPVPDMSILVLSADGDNSICFSGSKDIPCSILFLDCSDLNQVCQRLQDFFDDACGLGLFSESLTDILFFENGIQAMLDQTKNAFQNPIFVFDPDFKLIATTWQDEPSDIFGKRIVENGGFTESEFQAINQSKLHERVMKSDKPVHGEHPVYGYDQLLCSIDSQKNMGHIVLSGLHHKLTDQDARLLYLLKKAIDTQMKKDSFIRNNRGFHYEYFLRDLLDEKMPLKNGLETRKKYIEKEFYGTLYCMVIETARSSSILNTMHIRSDIDMYFPGSHSLMYNGQIVTVFSYEKTTFMPTEDEKHLKEFCKKNGLFAGISNAFDDIAALSAYYHQALRAYELGSAAENIPGLFIYDEYAAAHIASVFTSRESSETFCHPQLKRLIRYDRENHTSYAEYLYIYIICERNIAETARRLYLHRNTLTYHLKKIQQMIAVDLDNYKERENLLLSYELYRQDENRQNNFKKPLIHQEQ